MDDERRIGKKLIRCKCPRCGRMHTRFLFWTSPFLPRIFCIPCKFLNDDIAYEPLSMPAIIGIDRKVWEE